MQNQPQKEGYTNGLEFALYILRERMAQQFPGTLAHEALEAAASDIEVQLEAGSQGFVPSFLRPSLELNHSLGVLRINQSVVDQISPFVPRLDLSQALVALWSL